MRSRRVVVGAALLILGGAVVVGVVAHSSAPDVESASTNAEPHVPGLAAMVKRSHAAPRAERLPHATDPSRPHRQPRPPISTDYGPSSACGDIRYRAPPFNTASIRVAGAAGCEEARTLARRAHAYCGYADCDTGGYRCGGVDVATQVLHVACRSRESKLTWYASGGG